MLAKIHYMAPRVPVGYVLKHNTPSIARWIRYLIRSCNTITVSWMVGRPLSTTNSTMVAGLKDNYKMIMSLDIEQREQ